jgi:uncharacterized protein YacL (UPF0231 family)
MDSKFVDTMAGMYAEKVDMDKCNLEHIAEREVEEQNVEMQHVQHEVERGEEAAQKLLLSHVHQKEETRCWSELDVVVRLRIAYSPWER